MDDLKTLIEQCVALRPAYPFYARDFALFYIAPIQHDAEEWRAAIGGNAYVMLGEYDGDFHAKGHTAEKAVQALLEKLRLATEATA